MIDKKYFAATVGAASGVIYGLVIRGMVDFDGLQPLLGVMTFGFIFLTPFTVGVLRVYGRSEASLAYCIFMPWLDCTFFFFCSWLFGWEGIICITMALPVFFLMSSAGAVLFRYFGQACLKNRSQTYVLASVMCLPLVVSLGERQTEPSTDYRTVKTQIVIHAARETVWQNIIRVRLIKPEEQRPTLAHLIGFPRPLEATLTTEGVGGVRYATFEGGVLFVETITAWQPLEKIAFTIKADTVIPPATLDRHVRIGGEYFDTLDGTYEIEMRDANTQILHLQSTQRLSTGFNFYAGLWTDAVMESLQSHILSVIKARCEANASATSH
jgi:hypothetical protein